MIIKTVINKTRQTSFEKIVDPGEASAIALALEIKNAILIIDDKRGRILSKKLGIEISGTLGTLLKAKQKGRIPELKPILERLRLVNYRIAKDIENEILVLAGGKRYKHLSLEPIPNRRQKLPTFQICMILIQ